MLLLSLLLVDLVVSQHLLLSWLTPRWAGPGPGVRSSSRCAGRCENLLVCGLTGGHLVEQGQCSGLLSVCCLHPRTTTTPRLTRVPRQLSLQPSLPSLPRQARLATLNPPETPRFSYDVVPGGGRKPSASKYPEMSPETENLVGGGWRTCGQSRQVAQSRILGGADAGYGQFPWTALIQIYSKKHGLDKMCAGSLVQDRYILTAGHCVHYCREGLLPNCTNPIPVSELTFKVVLGQYDLLNPSKDDNIQRYYARQVFLHPDFTNIFRMRDDGFLESEPTNDVALLLLDRQVKPRANIGSICLPDSSLYLEAGTQGTVVGWGRLGVEEGSPHSSTLQAVTVPVLTRSECEAEPGASLPSQDQLCAGHSHSQQSACPGDSGGPLMIRTDDLTWRIIGIVSTGPAQCGVTPVIYHNVISSIHWIRNTIESHT